MRYVPTKIIGSLIISVILSCSGGGGSSEEGSSSTSFPGDPIYVDAESIQGRSEKAYYSTRSATSALIVLIDEAKPNSARKLEFKDGNVSLITAVPDRNILQDAEKKVLTLFGEAEIYELSSVTVDTLKSAASSLPAAMVEALCLADPLTGNTTIHNSPYTYFKVVHLGSGFEFRAGNSTTSEVLGGVGVVSKTANTDQVVFNKAALGYLSVDHRFPHAIDALFFKASFSSTTPTITIWDNSNSMYCRLNNVTVGLVSPSQSPLPQISRIASSVTQPVDPNPWIWFSTATWEAIDNVIGSSAVPWGQFSSRLYFSKFGFSFPSNAQIRQVDVTLYHKASFTCPDPAVHLQVKEAYLFDSGTGEILSSNAGDGSILSTTMQPKTLTLIQPPNSFIDANELNQATTTLAVRYLNTSSNCNQMVLIDHVKLTVQYQME